MTDGPNSPPSPGSNSLTRGLESARADSAPTADLGYFDASAEAKSSAGRYRIVKPLGSGGFGVVYRAWDDQLQRDVAIKVLVRNDGGGATEGLLTEARMLARLDHPAIVPVYDIGKNSNGHIFIVSKFVDGPDLARMIAKDRPGHRLAVQLIARIAEALDYAHQRGIIHRDVKPANILLHADGAPVLADFGLAMRDSEFSRGDRFAGTPAYMSPEQARHEGHRVDGRSDIYSLGTVLYELLTGHRPFQATTVDELLDFVRNVEVRPPRQLDHQIPRELERICLRALAKRAADRYSTAGDMAEDLRHWEASAAHPASVSHSPSPMDSQAGPESTTSAPGPVVIVPRGLRPFEATDADFFLHLLPGPRDRNGIPESVRFWKTRIEEPEADAAFRVGLLLGPSGCGKSSLLRAGVVPQLDARVHTVFVEARADDLEARLIDRLHRRIPATQGANRLHDCLTLVRQRRGLPAGHKLLLIIDQFEQWLNQHDLRSGADLVDALRQCDGVTLQTLLLVRDDFTLAATRFMEALEEPLLQNRNFATVDLFGIEHARRVLAAFGRSFGTLPDHPSREQQKFLETAVQELAQDGHIVPVRLAVFAEMVKDKPWTPATLHQFGGMQGIGVAFLEDRLAGPNSHPYLKAHLPLVKGLLQRLLPEGGTEIKGPAKTRQELHSAASDSSSSRDDPVEKVLALLDTETRLITPTGGEATGSTESSSATREQTYQLAHDYLVPALRTWLSAEERSTRAGRARFRLRELAEAWQRKPEPRRLPTWLEWSVIRGLTQRSAWSPTEQAMMTAARRRIVRTLSFLLLLTTVVFAVGHEALAWSHARALTRGLLNADTSELPHALPQIESLRRWTHPMLTRLVAESVGESTGNVSDERQRRRRLHVALALAPSDEGQWKAILEQLPSVPVKHLQAVRDCLTRSGSNVQERIWPAFQEAMSQENLGSLSLGAVLAGMSSDPQLWRPHVVGLTRQLAGVRAAQIADWCELYRPLAPLLTTQALELYCRPSSVVNEMRTNLVELISRYATEDCSTVGKAIEFAQAREIPLLLESAGDNSLAMRTELRKRLQNSRSPAVSTKSADMPEPGVEIKQQVAQAGGIIDRESCILYSLSQPEFVAISSSLAKLGYSPQSVRLFPLADQERIAAAYQRDLRSWEVEWRISATRAPQHVTQRREIGWELSDFSISEIPASSESGSAGNMPAWTLLYHKSTPPKPPDGASDRSPAETRVYFDLPLADHTKNRDSWPEQGFILARHDVRIPAGQPPLTTAIWRKVSDAETDTKTHWDYYANVGERFPGQFQTDLRSHLVPLADGDRLGLFEEFLKESGASRQSAGATLNPKDAARRIADTASLRSAESRSALGDFAEAEAILNEIYPRWQTSLRMHEYLAELYARMGNREKLRSEIDKLPELERQAKTERPKAGAVTYFQLREAVLAGNPELARQLLDEHAKFAEESAQRKEFYVRALAAVAGEPQLGDLARDAFQSLLSVLRQPATLTTLSNLPLLLSDVDLRSVRLNPTFQQFLLEARYDRRFHAAFYSTPQFESRQLLARAPDDHNREAMRLREQGFRPVVLDVNPGPSSDQVLCSSVWHRGVVPLSEQIEQHHKQANLILALALLQEYDTVFSALQGAWGRDVRTRVMIEASQLLRPDAFVARLLNDPSVDVETQRMLVLTLGGFEKQRVASSLRDHLELRITDWAISAEHPGLRSAAAWFARQWNVNVEPTSASRSNGMVNPKRKWTRNSLGQVMVEIHPAEKFLMGSPPWEEGRSNPEVLHWASIGYDYALGETEVTDAQFREFLSDPRIRRYYPSGLKSRSAQFSREPDCPRLAVERIDAQRFCQWLSEREGIPPEQRCYPDIWQQGAVQSLPQKELLRRIGFRLPTEMEWEYAARAGAQEAYYFGNDDSFLGEFEWMSRSAERRSHPVGQLRPNDFGLFDMLGNAMEWTADLSHVYLLPAHSPVRSELSRPTVEGKSPIARGGYFGAGPSTARAAHRTTPSTATNALGFRVARTIPQ